jgi:ABC-type antimicrobial peptide transport system permease subunit
MKSQLRSYLNSFLRRNGVESEIETELLAHIELRTVARRTSEIGVRMALGARARQVLFMILRESSSLALFGIAAGLAAAFGLTRFVRTILYGLQPTDPPRSFPQPCYYSASASQQATAQPAEPPVSIPCRPCATSNYSQPRLSRACGV